LIGRERSEYERRFRGSREAFAASGKHLLGGVPMTWMRMWPGGFPVYHAAASGARLTDIDGHEFGFALAGCTVTFAPCGAGAASRR
jgi:glutamate-1-semialdehyde 2,1-aminomutase